MITPIALPYDISLNTLSDMLLDAVKSSNLDKAKRIQKSIDFLLKNHEKQ